ncbi:MAG: D-2-hydroxyacid dehydrogenase [Planctomycetes bacterium]|nr:D-2-hydroxyacid dehydrogenase [Planctomycetota bacterium]
MKLLLHPPVEAERLSKITEAAGPMTVVNAADEAAAIAAVPDADAFFGKVTPAILAKAAKLRWVQTATVSLEHYMFPALVEHPCKMTNMRGLFSDVIADQVMGYVICFARNLHLYIKDQATATWKPRGGESARVNLATGPGVTNAIDRVHMHLGGMTMGVVGFGEIGSEIARRASAFDMKIIGVDAQPRKAPAGVEAVWPVERLPELLGRSDFVVIAAPHTPQTERLFRTPLFEQMKRSAYLINIGRGAIVDLTDLVAALKGGTIAGAALDVFETEPLPPEHPLWKFENVILTPHVAGYSPRIAERHLALLLDNIGRFVRGEELRNPVNKVAWF